ncbi:MAG: Gfo/Idh/MocA family oxidoreductase, partial [Thermodesulfobacteriota bacterium]|nr:Gfo/Idh/MocA family oxidoreductase [Thermodesulfobacteriota bacterium]
MEKIPVAVIGTGYLGRFHAQKYANLPEVELVGVVDIDPKRAEAVASETNTSPLSDYRDLYTQVKAASVVVPTPLHHSIAKDLLDHEINVLLEKPMTTTLEEARELNRIAR